MDQFIRRKTFPGTSGNPFDSFLHRTADFDKMPNLIFLAILAFLSTIPGLWDWRAGALVFAFMLLDWAIFFFLPLFHKSYGPPKTSVLILAVARTVLMILPYWLSIPLNLFGSLLVFWGTWVEPHKIKLTRQTLRTDKLPAGAGLRLLHLADLHIERLTGREEQLNHIISELNPDLILFSGDFLNLSYLHDAEALSDLRRVINAWQAPLGVFAVTGSPAVDLPELVPDLVSGSHIRLLQNETVPVSLKHGKIHIIGLTCTHRPHLDGPALEILAAGLDDEFKVLLYHTPDLAPLAAKAGMDLQLSGHTHGGQIRLPVFGALFTGSLLGKKFESGRYKILNMVLYVSRGLGMEGLGAPRARLFCPPEAILWEISGTKIQS